MTDTALLKKNLETLKERFPALSKKIENAKPSCDYSEFQTSKTGQLIPCFKTGNLLHSKYNPEREAERLFSGNENFVLFCGLGSGIHINYFLNTFKNKPCALVETDFSALKHLLTKIDFTGIFLNSNFTVLPPFEDAEFENELIQNYIPVLHGNFEVKFLLPWENYYKDKLSGFQQKIKESLKIIQSDTATQARFGKIWMRNILFNLKTASNILPQMPKADTNKTAYILGAGPCLENAIKTIKEKRKEFVLFAADTAFSVLNAYGITADFFISIDPQIFSYLHCFKPASNLKFGTEADINPTIGIFDLCSNPLTVKTFLQNGNKILFTAGAHPFAQYASNFSPFPYCNTSTGTVAGAAKYAAIAMGFKNFRFAGLDFAYTNGKAYARETYLSKLFFKEALKTSPGETKFCALMFRGNVEKKTASGKITYTTELLNRYAELFNINENVSLWQKKEFRQFPYYDFIFKLNSDAKKNDFNLKTAILPYLTYKSKILYNKNRNFLNLELALSEILEYTVE
ncbi:6-hydroxymethylpterin diphosphokinase MptE-like protein [Treponema pedis]|uniref:Motility associated factor glycosyltransferase family protein n=1 Tax=Treponema pedis TaxID=409322 RepID=A0A7S6WND5_9SPIR|nr:6-hydroxymethylpterin diphosphokinase MptE-like protein [Treponema pedis]QOW60338.1 motility associated factor glycosyltransferase family protein [Treponema pedis]